jgi:hypothetical protein
MKTMSKAIALLVMAGWLAALAPAVEAGTLQPEIGVAHFGSNPACFARQLGRVTNICSIEQWFELPLLGSYAGFAAAYVTAEGASPANNVGCLTASWDVYGNLVQVSPWQFLPSFGAARLLGALQVYVPYSGAQLLICQMQPNGVLHLVNW